MQTELTTILTNQAVLMTKIDHIRELVEKQNGRVGKLETNLETSKGEIDTRITAVEGRVTEGEKADIKSKAWLSGLAAGVGAIAAFSLDKVSDILKGFS
jgi:hypothetical protein